MRKQDSNKKMTKKKIIEIYEIKNKLMRKQELDKERIYSENDNEYRKRNTLKNETEVV